VSIRYAFLGLAALALAVGWQAASAPASLAEEMAVEAGVVDKVEDGDTIKVKVGKKSFTVQYAGIGAPEKKQLGAAEAKAANERLVKKQTVELEKDVTDQDDKKRLVRHVWLNGELISGRLLQDGHGWVRQDTPDAKHREQLLAAQRAALEARPGVGQTVELTKDNWRLTILERNNAKQLKGLGTETAQGTYLVLTVQMENIGQKAQSLGNDRFKVFDDRRREYKVYTKGNVTLTDEPKGLTLTQSVNPGLAGKVRLVFDLPPDATGLTLEIMGKTAIFLGDMSQ
jgi:endonuclease YncB( thermonuclease family)